LLARERKGSVGYVLFLAAQADGLADKEVGEHEVRSRGSELVGVAIGIGFDAFGVAEAVPLPQQSVDVKLSAAPQANAKEQIGCKRLLDFAVAVQAIRPRIRGGEASVALRSLGHLSVQVPA